MQGQVSAKKAIQRNKTARYVPDVLGALRILGILSVLACIYGVSLVPPATAAQQPLPHLSLATQSAQHFKKPKLSKKDSQLLDAAFKAADQRKWKHLLKHLKSVKDPQAAKLLQWVYLAEPNSKVSFDALNHFISQNPHWPHQHTLRRKAEETMPRTMSAKDVLAWFEQHPPLSTEGKIRKIGALLDTGVKEKANALIREAWVGDNFTKHQERTFYRKYRKVITHDDHVARMERLIWNDQYWQAKRMLLKVNKAYRALAMARIALMRNEGNVDTLIKNVPDELKNHPGLVYERVRWRRRKGKYDSASELLMNAPKDLMEPAKWWQEQKALARTALRHNKVETALKIISGHNVSTGVAFAEAEWLAGWIELRKAGNPKRALYHFQRMYDAVRFPISRSRGAYWAGRAAAALGREQDAQQWYEIASQHANTYYGQLAHENLNPGSVLAISKPARFSAVEKTAFANNELVNVLGMLDATNQQKRMRPFIIHLAKFAPKTTPPDTWYAMLSSLARERGRIDLGIQVARIAVRDGVDLGTMAYPVALQQNGQAKKPIDVELPLLLALIRQESGFYTGARSHVGARGLMQLMPYTAKRVAKRIGLPYSKQKLLSDPAYNLAIGSTYIDGLIDNFQGSYVMALAAYNAGPSRVRQWIKQNGDPRTQVDAIDWIESIPFDETRNYVQRVMENLQVYRHALSNEKIALNLKADLNRNHDGPDKIK